jgi:very-short-patch-repair endonuclease
MHHIDRLIAVRVAANHGIVTRRELLADGISRTAIRRRLGDGTLVERHPGVLLHAAHAANPSRHSHMLAAVRACGDDAALSHESAAELHGIWQRPSGRIDVTSTSNQAATRTAGFDFHRRTRDWNASDVTIVDGIPVTSALLTCVQLGTWATPHQIARIIGEARFRELIDIADLAQAVDEAGPAPGIGNVRDGIELHLAGSAGTRTRGEDRLHEAIVAARLPKPLVNVRGATGLAGVELDFVWPRHRVVVEVDGPQHRIEAAAASDQLVDEQLVAVDWLPLRFVSLDVWRRPDRVVHRIRRALDARIPSRARKRAL